MKSTTDHPSIATSMPFPAQSWLASFRVRLNQSRESSYQSRGIILTPWIERQLDDRQDALRSRRELEER